MSPETCPICAAPGSLFIRGSEESSGYFRRQAYTIASGDRHRRDVFICSRCGHGWSDFPCGETYRWYESSPADTEYLSQERGRRKSARRLLDGATTVCPPPGSLLDIGASAGFLVEEARRRGYNARGIEPALWALAEAEKRGLGSVIDTGDAHDLSRIQNATVDMITAVDLIEHLEKPGQFLAECRRILKPNGCLVLVTPQFDSIVARLLRSSWYCIMPAHLHYFTRASMRGSLADAGFRVAYTNHFVRYFGWKYVWRRLFPRLRLLPLPFPDWVIPVPLFDTMTVVAVRAHE